MRAQPNTDITWLNSNSLLWLYVVFHSNFSEGTDPMCRILELNVGIICGCMPTLKPILRKTIWRTDNDTHRVPSYTYNNRSTLKNSAHSRSIGDGLMDASYIELGPPGTNRDVHIAAEKRGIARPWPRHGINGIMKTDTFGQDVTYKDPDDPR